MPDTIITLLSDSGTSLLQAAMTELTRRAIKAGSLEVSETDCSHQNYIHAHIAGEHANAINQILPEIRHEFNVDGLSRAVPSEPIKLFLADMEATIIKEEMVDVIAERLGIHAKVAQITKEAMDGRIDFEASLRTRTEFLRGVNESLLRELCEEITFAPGAKRLVKTLKAWGVHTALVTGGYSIFAEYVAKACGFDAFYASHLEMRSGKLTGGLSGVVMTAEGKRDVAKKLAQKLGITPQHICAVGDGANDVHMLNFTEHSVSYNGKEPACAAAALSLNHTDLTGILALFDCQNSKP